jgi:hypothetical protein
VDASFYGVLAQAGVPRLRERNDAILSAEIVL